MSPTSPSPPSDADAPSPGAGESRAGSGVPPPRGSGGGFVVPPPRGLGAEPALSLPKGSGGSSDAPGSSPGQALTGALRTARAARRFYGLWALWGGLTGGLTLLVLGAFLGWWPEATAAGAGPALWWAYALGWLPAWAALALWLRAARGDLHAHAPALGRDPKAPLVSAEEEAGSLAANLLGATSALRGLTWRLLHLPTAPDRRSAVRAGRVAQAVLMTALSVLLLEFLARSGIYAGPALALHALARGAGLLLGVEFLLMALLVQRGVARALAWDPAAVPAHAEPVGAAGARRDRGWIHENLEALVIAVIIALTIKSFALEAFQIPTGSMKPTLLGVEPGDVIAQGDRILVSKFAYADFGLWRHDPERWDVVVFKYPLQTQKNFIKRLVGLPGETLRVKNGDLYRREADGRWQMLRKPPAARRSTWLPSHGEWQGYDSRDQPALLNFAPAAGARGAGHWDSDGAYWREEERDGTRWLRADCPAGQTKPLWLRYREPVPAAADPDFARGAALLGMPTDEDRAALSGDLRIAFDYRRDGEETLHVALEEVFGAEEQRLAIEWAFAPDGRGRWTFRLGAAAPQSGALHLGRALPAAGRLVVWHLDDAFGAGFSTEAAARDWHLEPYRLVTPDGGEVEEYRYDYEPEYFTRDVRVGLGVRAAAEGVAQPPSAGRATPPGAAAAAAPSDGGVALGNVVIRRDLYYTTQRASLLGGTWEGRERGRADEVVFAIPKAEDGWLGRDEDQYFCMGDNSAHSKDSRVWIVLELELADGRRVQTDAVPDDDDQQITQIVPLLEGLGIGLRSDLAERLYRRPGPFKTMEVPFDPMELRAAAGRLPGEDARGPVFNVFDLYGRRQRFAPEELAAARVYAGHYVPRSYFLGKALLVFWPPFERLKIIR